MTIAIVTGIYPPTIGGAGAVMHSLAARAPDRIAVITAEYDQNGNRIRDKDVPSPGREHVYVVPWLSRALSWPPRGKLRALVQAAHDRFLFCPKASQDLIHVLDSVRPEMVCIGTLPSCHWVVDATRRWQPSIKVVVYVHGEEVPTPSGGFHSRMHLRALQNASQVVAVSSFTRVALVSAGVPSGKIAVITNGVDVSRFQPGTKSLEIVKRYGLENRSVLLTLARLDERKGQDMLIRSLPKIRTAVPDVVYLVVGEGSYGSALRGLVSELGLDDAVIFTGAVSDEQVVEFYLTCDVYAMPNRTTENGDTEGFGLVFLEAGACGKPVIGGMAGGVPDAVLHEKTGLLVDGTSVDAIADACIRLLKNTSLRDGFGANGLIHARNNDWGTKTEQFLSLCDSL